MRVTVTELTQLHKCEAQVAYDAVRGRKRSDAWERKRVEGVAAHKRLEGQWYRAGGRGKGTQLIVKTAAAFLFVLFYVFFVRGGQ
jgi:hypothetical protein